MIKKVLIMLFSIWFCISITYYLITNTTLSLDGYMQHLTTTFPNFMDLITDIKGTFEPLTIINLGNTLGDTILFILKYIGNVFKLIYVVLLQTPIKLVVYLLKTLWAIMPFAI